MYEVGKKIWIEGNKITTDIMKQAALFFFLTVVPLVIWFHEIIGAG